MTEKMDGYIRVSRRMGREGESYISPSVQRAEIERWAEYKGITIDAWHTDEDWSGGTHDRPGLEAAVARCLSGETGGIVSANIDRFSRTTELGLRDLRRLQERGARLAFVREDVDTGSVYGRVIYTIFLAMAEAFLENIKASWVTAKTRAVQRGAKISRTPWGYQRNADGTLSPHPERAPVVMEAFRLAAGENLHAAMAYLQDVAPERHWTTTKARRLLGQRVYLGETRYGDLVQTDTHEALASRAAFEAAQTEGATRRPRAEFPLSGFPTCGTCGTHMVGARGGKGVRMYRCADGLKRGRPRVCTAPVVTTAQALEEYVQREGIKTLGSLTATIGDAQRDRLRALEEALEDAELELDAFAADTKMRRALGDRYHAHLDDRVQAVEAARDAYREFARVAEKQRRLSVDDLMNTDDPQLFLTGVRSLFATVIVKRMRGRVPVERRVTLVPVEADDAAGEAAA